MDESRNIFQDDVEPKFNYLDTAWLLISSLLAFLMIFGFGFYYGGYVQRKNQLSMLAIGAISMCLLSIQWYMVGYSLVFANTNSRVIGNFDHAFLIDVGTKPNKMMSNVSSNVFMIFKNMFAVLAPYIAFGAPAERATVSSFLIFLVIWSIFVYDFTSYWIWNKNGWLKYIGTLDFAGGIPVHVSSGFSALAYGMAVGPRKPNDSKTIRQPSSIAKVYLGTGLIWLGWFGLNGGSEGQINSRAVNSIIVTNLSGCVAGLTWIILNMITKRSRKWTLNGFCTGAICGLVAITPACGYVQPSSSLIFGFVAAIACYYTSQLTCLIRFHIDDACNVFAVHGVGGMVGMLLTGLFAQNSVATMSGGQRIPGGFLDKNFYQILPQLISIGAVSLWSFLITFCIVKIIHFMPGVDLRLSNEDELVGSDCVELGETVDGRVQSANDMENGWHSKRNGSLVQLHAINPLRTSNVYRATTTSDNEPVESKQTNE